jgi:hypothetical protein
MTSLESRLNEAVTPDFTGFDVYESIAAVVKAINELLPSLRGFALAEFKGNFKYSNNKELLD